MKPKDIFDLALTSIRHRHLRSWLTILGIVIGVASIITLIGISLGISSQISSRLSTLGSNIITITAGGQQASRMGGGMFVRPTAPGPGQNGREGTTTPEITFREADDLRTLPGVYRLDTRIQKRETMQYRDKNTSLTVTGTDPAAFKDSVGIPMLYGRYLNPSDQYSAVIGFGVANQTFNDLDILNKQVKIDGVPFHVVGILNESGGGGFGSADSSVFIPLNTAKDMFNQTTDVSQVIAVVSPDHDTDTVASELESELIILHRVTKDTEDFTITTAATLESTVSSVTDTLGLLLGGIASISLLVGGIGVANTMFMSVLEQTRDIGVYKSLGAKNRDVVYMFLCEAAIIGFVGGFLGVALSFVVSAVLGNFGVPITISTELVLGGLFFSVVIGVVAGWAPARGAASIPPVEALRYE